MKQNKNPKKEKHPMKGVCKVKQIIIILAGLLLVGSQLACRGSTLPQGPTIEVGEMLERQETIPLEDAESAAVKIVFGAGELDVEAGASDQLFSGDFRYNVAEWEPEVAYEDGVLIIEQGSTGAGWVTPFGSTRNEWKLAFSPEIPLEMEIKVYAGEGDLDFTGLQLTGLDLELGAGDITLDLTGTWLRSVDVRITTGVGAVTLHLPDDVGVRVEVEGGLSSVDASDLSRRGGAYVNDAFGEAEVELRIHVTTGVGALRLLEISN